MRQVVTIVIGTFIFFIGAYAQSIPNNVTLNQLDSTVKDLVAKRDFEKAITIGQQTLTGIEKEINKEDTLYAQVLYSLSVGYYYQQDLSKSKQILSQVIAILEEKYPETEVYLKALNSYGVIAWRTGELKEAEIYLSKANELRAKTSSEKSPTYIRGINNLALLYGSMGEYDKAESILLKTLDLRRDIYGEKHAEIAENMNSLAILYRTTERYEEAEPMFLEAKNMLADLKLTKMPSYRLVVNNLGIISSLTGNDDQAAEYFKEVLEIYRIEKDLMNPDYGNTLYNLGIIYKNQKAYEEAKVLYLEALAIRERLTGSKSLEYLTIYEGLAALYSEMNEPNEAEQIYLEVLEKRRLSLGKSHQDVILVLNNLASLYEKSNRKKDALQKIDEALFANTGIHLAPIISKEWCDKLRIIKPVSINRLETTLACLYTILAQDETKPHNERLVMLSEAALYFLTQNKDELEQEGDKLRLLTLSNDWVLRCFDALDLKKAASKAFTIAEQNKSVLLKDAYRAEEAYSFGDLPDSLVQYEKRMLKQYQEIKAAILQNISTTEKDSLIKIINVLNIDIKAFKSKLKKEYPRYAALKEEAPIIEKEAVQAVLDEHTAIIEYVLSPTKVYILYLDKNQLLVEENSIDSIYPKMEAFQQVLSDYKLIVSNPELSRAIYIAGAVWCYQNLLAKVLEKAKNIDHLVIIPDGPLSFLPFETFLTEEPGSTVKYQDFPYLLNQYKITYNYSAALWKENKESPKNKNNGLFLGMAANYGEAEHKGINRASNEKRLRGILNPLPAARIEVEKLSTFFKGYCAFDNLASETVFKEKAADYAVIHLAMHGLLNSKNPILSSLAFTEDGDSIENNFLHAYEISKMKLHADLVVLSACETGFGKFEKGNGVASLARAFMYAGVPAMVVTLWQVNDESTSMIMQYFYTNLASGMDKAEALQKAKIEYIATMDKAGELVAAHPAFWSPFIQIGDSRPIKLGMKVSTSPIWWALGGVGVLVFIGAVFIKRRKRRVAA